MNPRHGNKAHQVFDWHGISGLDVLYNTSTDQAVVIDPNFRNNASTPLQITRTRLNQHRLLTMGALKYHGTEAEFIKHLETCRLNGSMLQEVLHPFGGAFDQEKKILKLYAAIGAASAKALDDISALLRKSGIDFA